jgi:hypothetical protein
VWELKDLAVDFYQKVMPFKDEAFVRHPGYGQALLHPLVLNDYVNGYLQAF